MKSFKIKALALAVTGLAGLGLAGSALACPAGATTAQGGAWSGSNVTAGTFSIVAGGLESPTPSACGGNSVITANNPFASAAVVDNSPGTQGGVTTYRAQFLINADAITGLDPFNGAQVFALNSANSASTSNPTTQILKATITGTGASKKLNFILACSNGGNDRCSPTAATMPSGVVRVEVQVIIGSGTAGQFNYWINNNNSASPTGTFTGGFDNHLWVAGSAAVLGLANPTKGFMTGGTSQLNHAVLFDAFDSRRTTFIGTGS